MKVLVLNETLPDNRVEKAIKSLHSFGYHVEVLVFSSRIQLNDIPIHQHPELNLYLALFRPKTFRKRLLSLIEALDPDVIYANNVFLAHAVLNMGKPLVYDDHEFWSAQERANHPFALPWTRDHLKKKITWIYRYFKVKSWEKELLSQVVSLSPHERIAADHQRFGMPSFVLPNYPQEDEVKEVWQIAKTTEREYDTLYIGRDLRRKSYAYRQGHQTFRILRQCKDISLLIIGDNPFEMNNGKIRSVGYLPHEEIYKYSLHAKTGLIPWKPHPYHQYASANKLYLYYHSGAQPILPITMANPLHAHALVFHEIKEIPSLIREARKNNLTDQLIEHARRHFLWEYYEENIKRAVEAALEYKENIKQKT